MVSLQKPARKRKPVYKTASEKRHMDAVGEMPCILSGVKPIEIHHCGTYMGGKKNHLKTIPLSVKLHAQRTKQKAAFFCRHGTESDLLKEVYALLDEAGKLEPGARAIWDELR